MHCRASHRGGEGPAAEFQIRYTAAVRRGVGVVSDIPDRVSPRVPLRKDRVGRLVGFAHEPGSAFNRHGGCCDGGCRWRLDRRSCVAEAVGGDCCESGWCVGGRSFVEALGAVR